MSETASELRAKIREKVSPRVLDTLLDGWPEAERVAAACSLGRSEQVKLWHLVEGYRPVRLTDIVPPSVGAMQPVRHFGHNSMLALTSFEKVFFRAADQDPAAPRLLGGLNVHVTRPIAGPGYFVTDEVPARGEVRIDYSRVPESAPEGWPKIVDNESGLRKLFYGFTQIDTLRRVSEHVTIGHAERRGHDIGAYFVLCRKEAP